MKEKIENIRLELQEKINNVKNLNELNELKAEYLGKKGKVTDTVNVRKNASTSANILGILNKGSEIKVIEQMSNGWTKIEHPNGTAYIKSDYVEMQ